MVENPKLTALDIPVLESIGDDLNVRVFHLLRLRRRGVKRVWHSFHAPYHGCDEHLQMQVQRDE